MGNLSQASTRLLEAQDFDAWVALRDTVLDSLPNSDVYVREDDEENFFQAHMYPGGEVIGVFVEDALVAYAMLELPGEHEAHNLGQVIGLAPEQQGMVAHLSSCMVLPQWRGRQLQRALLSARLELALACGRPLCMAMVSLLNHRSRHNMLRQGLRVVWTGMIDGLQRHVAMIDLEQGMGFAAEGELLLPSLDYEALRAAALAGYACVGEVRAPDGAVSLRYARHLVHNRGPR
ncbi:GNAT superfamily N-acetyltransferase [Acidovorax soli]|uniref:GNAT superfamily N-acetyltransferase n=1 Tax=Acidovorax soli TaxID=592050 RepID=A0A7X0PEW7_9BURK|nr:GNAT family N-acetyltransferase [Acidovorax soli]MBB6560705.1 GNAT superfamily N-acetyltransferase [Acidovorax soli]